MTVLRAELEVHRVEEVEMGMTMTTNTTSVDLDPGDGQMIVHREMTGIGEMIEITEGEISIVATPDRESGQGAPSET